MDLGWVDVFLIENGNSLQPAMLVYWSVSEVPPLKINGWFHQKSTQIKKENHLNQKILHLKGVKILIFPS